MSERTGYFILDKYGTQTSVWYGTVQGLLDAHGPGSKLLYEEVTGKPYEGKQPADLYAEQADKRKAAEEAAEKKNAKTAEKDAAQSAKDEAAAGALAAQIKATGGTSDNPLHSFDMPGKLASNATQMDEGLSEPETDETATQVPVVPSTPTGTTANSSAPVIGKVDGAPASAGKTEG